MAFLNIPYSLKFKSIDVNRMDGITTGGGELSADRLLLALKSGYFPWVSQLAKLTWWSPNKRMVAFPSEVKVSKSISQMIMDNEHTVTFNEATPELIEMMSKESRFGQKGDWINNNMVETYQTLSQQGKTLSVEVWKGQELVGGVFGVKIGSIFFLQATYAIQSAASKLAFFVLAKKLVEEGCNMIDCQVFNHHIMNMGAEEISRESFIAQLNDQADEINNEWDEIVAA